MTDDLPRVLVVEDEPDLAALYRDWLTDEYAVTVAGTVAEGTAAVDDATDVVLLDRRLPDGDGQDVLEHVQCRNFPCRVAMVTAVDPDFDIVDMGFDDYLVKPVTRDSLHETIGRLLARRQYAERLRTYVSLVSKRSLLNREKSEDERANSTEYTALEHRIDMLENELGDIVGQFDDEDFDAAFYAFRRERDGD